VVHVPRGLCTPRYGWSFGALLRLGIPDHQRSGRCSGCCSGRGMDEVGTPSAM